MSDDRRSTPPCAPSGIVRRRRRGGIFAIAATLVLGLFMASGPSVGAAAVVTPGGAGASTALTGARPSEAVKSPGQLMAGLPLTFERNEGQVSPAVRYLARGPGYTIFLTDR